MEFHVGTKEAVERGNAIILSKFQNPRVRGAIRQALETTSPFYQKRAGHYSTESGRVVEWLASDRLIPSLKVGWADEEEADVLDRRGLGSVHDICRQWELDTLPDGAYHFHS